MDGQHIYFSVLVEDPKWEQQAFGEAVNAKTVVALSRKAFNECTRRERLHERLVQSLADGERAIPHQSILELQIESSESRSLSLCNAEGHLVSKVQIQRWQDEVSRGDGGGAVQDQAFEVVFRPQDMVSKDRVESHDVKVNLRTATENETAGQAGVEPTIFSISEFIDNSITALIDQPEDGERVVDVYAGREKLKDRLDGGKRAKRGSLSYVAVIDSGKGMNDFQPIARRGQVPHRSSKELAQRHASEEAMISEELKRPFLMDDDLSAFGEGCTKVMSDLGSYMYILTRKAGMSDVMETLIDRDNWHDKFSTSLPQVTRAILKPDQGASGPDYMPLSEWNRTLLSKVPGATASSILPRILSYAERIGHSEVEDGAHKGKHSFTAFIVLDLHKADAEKVIFRSFHRLCNTLKVIYYHFLGHSQNFKKTINSCTTDSVECLKKSPTKTKRVPNAREAQQMSRVATKIHVFFHDECEGRRPWDLLPGETVVDKFDRDPVAESNAMKQEWIGVSTTLTGLFSSVDRANHEVRHRWYDP